MRRFNLRSLFLKAHSQLAVPLVLGWIVGVGLAASSGRAAAFGPSDGVLNPMELSRAGLQRIWTTQAEMSKSDRVVFAQLHVSNTRATVYFEIFVGDELRLSFATLDRDALGNQLGYERAKELADLQREIIEQEVVASLADRNLSSAEFSELVFGTSPEAAQKRQELLQKANRKVEVRKYVEPRMTLYVLNGHNVLQAFNAETGELRWTTQVGPRDGASMGVAANDAMVAVVNGQRIYCLDADQGRVLWSHRCDGSPNAAPAMSHTHIFVPLMDGRVESFSIASDGVESGFYVSYGRVSAQPFVTGRTVSWPTDKGHYYVAYFDEIGPIKYRIRTNDAIVTNPAKLGRVLFVASTDGYVYAVDEVLGTIYWEFSTGSSISQPPLAIGESVYLVTDNNDLYKIDSKTGSSATSWPKSVAGIRRLVGAADQHIYAENTSGDLVAIRDDNGGREYSIRVGGGYQLLNSQTDRIFLISNTGNIQCLRQNSQVHPAFHVPVSEAISAMETSGIVPKQTWRQRKAAQIDEQVRNPFETKEELSQDPFGASEPVYKNPFLVESAGEVNPFELTDGGAPKSDPGQEAPAKTAAPNSDVKQPADANDPFKGGRP